MITAINLIGPGGIDPTSITSAKQIYEVIYAGIKIAYNLIGGIAVIYALIGCFNYITSGGDEAKQATAKRTIVAAVIGLIIVLSSFVITNEIKRRLGYQCVKCPETRPTTSPTTRPATRAR